MRRILIVVLASVLVDSLAPGQSTYPSYYSQNDFLPTSPGAFRFGLYGYDNPALTSMLQAPDAAFLWSDQYGRWSNFNRWGIFAAAPGVGFGAIHQKAAAFSITDYRISLAAGDRTLSTGIAFGWSAGSTDYFGRSNLVTLGSIFRPDPHFSAGFVGTLATQSRGSNAAVLDLAVRPFATELITLFGDCGIQSHQSLNDARWSAGGAVEFLPGISLTGRYFDTRSFSLGVQLSLGRIGVSSQRNYDANQNHRYTTYGIRIGAWDRTILPPHETGYVKFDLLGPIKYQRYRFFDHSNTLEELLNAIDAAEEDPSVGGIAINTSGLAADKELLWEIRKRLNDFRASGKHVVIFVDRPGMNEYHFASVADKIIMDPQGLIQLQGFVMGRTFLKGTLEKIGVGFDEWRFFKYKSANEIFSRDSMSDADREQRQKLIDDSYRLAKTDICERRGFTSDQFDSMVNTEVVYSARDALAKGLVDTIGRWETVASVIKKLDGAPRPYLGSRSLDRFIQPNDNRWSNPPAIAVIYALGECAMDAGISARRLVHDVEWAVNSSDVKAVVLRVDSPGGDAMASDYIAAALEQAKGKKPVIVSQGSVAASGGYWLSMYADTIVAAPNTVTGSIGVIGGWVYDKGLKEKLGMSTDFVKTGEHADLGFGFRLPLIGLGLPDRNLTEKERSRMEYTIRSMYDDFIHKVAVGRKKNAEAIDSIGQGRVWSGSDGLANGLVDILGGLETAIDVAKERARIPKPAEIKIVELPAPGFINFSQFLPNIFGLEPGTKDPMFEQLKFRLQHNGQPMPMLPIDDIDMSRTY